MPAINKMISDANGMRKNILKSLQEYIAIYSGLEKEVQDRFRTEYKHNNHKIVGLEDFHMLSAKCKKNLLTVKAACNLLSRMSDLSGFDIEEDDLSKILKD